MKTKQNLRYVQVGPRGDHGQVEYEVWRGDVLLGTVERYAHASYRSLGRGSRIRGSLQGYSRRWRPLLPLNYGGDIWSRCVMRSSFGDKPLALISTFSLGKQTRREAVALLEAWHDHPEQRREA